MTVRCPHGREVGAPPILARCPDGFPGCPCGDDIVANTIGDADDQTARVLSWWQNHGSEL